MKKALIFTTAMGMALGQPMIFQACAEDVGADRLLDRIERLEADNARLKEAVEALLQDQDIERLETQVVEAGRTTVPEHGGETGATSLIGVSPDYGFRILDHAENVNRKRLLQLKARQEDALGPVLTLSGQVTVLADYQSSNRDDKFGYLMRHPTFNNQIGDSASEAVVHSATLGVTATLSDNVTAYFEMLYDPEQSFGAGTITSLARNQVQMRKAYLLWGNPDHSPVYAAIGKMDTPFGLNDTVSPFTNSSAWHAFAGLAYGAEVGYLQNGLSLRAMAIQGGSQFRAANTEVDGTNVPSRLNNFALDGSYTASLAGEGSLLIGGSYLHGSAYCQEYPVVHFNPCEDNNPSWSLYGTLDYGKLKLLGEYAQTSDAWPGSAVPDPTNPLSRFEAQETRAFTIGGRYGLGAVSGAGHATSDVSLEFSSFVAGDKGAPWERQDQWVLGYSRYLSSNLNLFSEFVHVDGYAPLNFISGGNFPDGSSWSDRDAQTDIVLVGAQAAF
ncbi:MAG: hypothetical protein H6846_06125 [Hyphomonas sp.]|nr:hypothetical protein [Hyphomonas sp.]